ncbi:DUF3857 domain-containing transglutaminase family protein [Halanaerobacter jeridensis]|uniref:DUF3857 domain-containing protein n=1 Tax=Halanaerobacter jeridensis TaxID=706427 RepID=A0A938XQ25_9FIRM|nr:DUF3857 and transglutaminase domain-containing protein [Halanaerobacter jeridensis]MBM7555190.1 hypothetical protein [Halanaerobacter jeridensis]
MKKRCLLLVVLVLLFTNTAVALEKDPNQLLQEAPSQFYYPDKDAVVWKEEQVFDYSQKPYRVSHYRAIKVFNQQGVKDYSQVKINYHPQWHKLNITTALIIKPSGELITVSEEKISKQAAKYTPNSKVYQSKQEKIINFPEVEAGSIIIYAYQKQLKRTLIPNEIQFATTFTSHRSEIVLKLPKGRKINTKIKPKNELNQAVINTKGEIKEYTWSGYKSEGELLVSTLNSWLELSHWYNNLITQQGKLTPDVKQKVKKLTAGLTTKKAKIKALYNYVAEDIRYLDYQLGVNGYQPLAVKEIYKHKYAVTKDKVYFLIALLKEINVPAEAVLVDRKSNFDAGIVVVNFNHMLLYLPQQDLYLNPNSGFIRYGNLPLSDQGKRVLSLAQGQIRETPILSKERNQEQVTATINLKEEGAAAIDLKINSRGFYDFIAKALFGELSPMGQREASLNILNKHFSGLQLNEIDIKGINNLTELAELNFKFTVEDYYQTHEDKALLQVNQLAISFLLSIAEARNTIPCKIERKIVINIPSKYNSIILPKDKKFINNEGEIRVNYQKKENQIISNFSYQFNRLAGVEKVSWVYINDLLNNYREIKEQQILLE